MCVYSMVIEAFKPIIPTTWDPFQPMPIPPSLLPQQLAEILAAFRKATEAAKAADVAAGQPDCEDPEKVKLLERVVELEKEITALKRKKRKKK